MTTRFIDFHDPADDQERRILAQYTVCPTCGGEGQHSGHLGEPGEDLLEDDQWREDYFAGRFDRPCQTCEGQRVVLMPDRIRAAPGDVEAWDRYTQERYEIEQALAAERRMGA